ncbi:MAG TPA: anti-sigma-F factor Fin family protein [Bacilli bacterium]
MAVNYICRHCHTLIGRIEDAQVSEMQLGFHFLTPGERRDIITYDQYGGVSVKVVCDFCKDALDYHPELSLLSTPLQ